MKGFLLFLSKTDKSIYNKCPNSAKNNQLALGLFVLLTGILAFFSGTFALSNLFYDFNRASNEAVLQNNGILYASILGFFYAIVIMAIDREVVSAKNKMAVIPRLCLAIVIGVIVAIPIELKLLEGRIDKKIIKDSRIENRSFVEEKENKIQAFNTKKSDLQKNIDNYQKKVDEWTVIIQREIAGIPVDGKTTGKRGCGIACEEAKRTRKYYENIRDKTQTALNNYIAVEYNSGIEKVVLEYENKIIDPEFDLLSKFQALNKIIKEDKEDTNSAGWMSWGIRILFILFEIIPSLVKLMTPQSEYDALLEARRRMNIQLTNVRANEAIEDLENIDDIIKNGKKPLQYIHEIKERIMI